MHPHLSEFISRLSPDSFTEMRGNIPLLRNGDVFYPFRQSSDFLYLTGLSSPELVLTICGQEVILWREPLNQHDILWGSDKLSDMTMRQISGIEDIRDRSGLDEYRSRHHTKSTQSYQSLLTEMRMIKSDEEIEKIQKCIRITEIVYEDILKHVQPGMYEYELEAMVAYGFRKCHGVEAFPTIVASGPNSCTLHYTANTRKLKHGDIVLLDFGIELDGYGADISRTFAVGGFSLRQREIYDAVLEVKNFAEETLRPGTSRTLWNEGVKEYMYDTCVRLSLPRILDVTPKTNPYFPHSIGHFLGLDTHDVGDSHTLLMPGMILTIEPGIYIPEESLGIRIEDDYLVTEHGQRKLS